ncbi:MAG: hypothetical protein RMM31_06515 [Anaerolineae bacterium]|nr:hypothetical protein [Anaerolineae bacterium]
MIANPIRKWIAFLAILVPTLVYVAALLFDPGRALVLWERGSVQVADGLPLALAMLGYASLAAVAIANLPDKLSFRRRAALLAGVFLSGLVLQTAATRVVEVYPLRALFLRQYSDFTGGYFTVGVRVDDLRAWLDRFAEEMAQYNVHAERHPPGLPMIFWALTQLASLLPSLATQLAPALRPLACFDLRAAQLSDVQILAGALGAVLESVLAWLVPLALFVFVRQLSNDRAAATAALLYPLIPGALQWVSQWNRSFGLFALLGLLLVERLIGSKRLELGLAALTGLVLSAAVWMSFGNVPILMIVGGYAVVRVAQAERLARVPLWALRSAVAGLSLVAPWIVAVGLAGFDPFAAYQRAMQVHLALDRDYWPFVVWHAWDILTFAGLPLSTIALLLAWRQSPALAIAWSLTLVAQCVLHVARGETGRVWMYFAPLIVGLSGMWLVAQRRAVVVSVLALLVVQSFVHIVLLRVISYGVDPLTAPRVDLPSNITETNVRFEHEGEIRLLGYRLSRTTFAPGESGTLELFWQHQGKDALPVARKVFIHFSDALEDEYRIVNQDGRPANWALPTTCWLPSQVIYDPHSFTVDLQARPGVYWVLVGLYDEHTGERAHVHTAQIARYGAVALPTKVLVAQ